jgi:hypothetical protein
MERIAFLGLREAGQVLADGACGDGVTDPPQTEREAADLIRATGACY